MYGWEFPPHNSGGLGVACYGLTRGLVGEGTDVRFVLPRKYPVAQTGATMVFADESNPLDGEQARAYASGYITEDQLAFLRGQYPELQYGTSLFDEVLRYAALSPLAALQHQPDVIHMHDWLAFPAGMAAKRATGAPLVAHVHATEFDRTGHGNVNQSVYDIERRGLYEADAIVAVSEYTKNLLVDRYGVDPNKVQVVHNAIDADDNAVESEVEREVHRLRKEGWGIVLFVGRLTLQKGPDYFIDAAQKVLVHRPNTLFLVSGSGDMAREMIDRAAFLGISDKVLFTGFLRNQELARLYKTADLLVMPSVSEPFGIVPLESLLNGTPVLISKQSGVAEVLTGALKVDFWDTNEMANQIISILDHPALRDTLAHDGAKNARTQVWKNVAEKCIRIYDKLVATVARKTPSA
jgi:glycogen(starch) synthase